MTRPEVIVGLKRNVADRIKFGKRAQLLTIPA